MQGSRVQGSNTRTMVVRRIVGLATIMLMVVMSAGCSDEAVSQTGVRTVTADAGAELLENAPAGLVVLDVRTAEEYSAGHLEGATLIDFYGADFAAQIAELDRDTPYLLYCRSGNRSGQTRALMADLGFTDVADVEGGILAWVEGGHSTVQ